MGRYLKPFNTMSKHTQPACQKKVFQEVVGNQDKYVAFKKNMLVSSVFYTAD